MARVSGAFARRARRASLSRNSRDVTGRPARRKSSQIRTENRDCCRCDAGNPERLAKRVRPDLPQALDDFAGEAGNALERKIVWNTPPLVTPRPLDLAFLAPQISC